MFKCLNNVIELKIYDFFFLVYDRGCQFNQSHG